VFCQLDALRHCLPSSLRRTLAELPESLDETYERIVKDIKKGNRADAYRMLQCLAVAIRPLSVAELAELLAFDFDTSAAKGGIPQLNSKWRWEDHEQAVLSICSSLITIVPAVDSPVVQFSHFSVKEFLLSDRLATSSKDISQYHIALEDANTLIARACLGFLLRDLVDESDPATALSPLALYAAEHWVAHAKVDNVSSRIRNGMESLFDPDRPYFSAWIQLYDGEKETWYTVLENKIQPEAGPLYHAALYGFHEIVERLTLEYPQYANAISGRKGTALHSASFAGHVEVVRSLLKCGVDVDARGCRNMSPLQLASLHGHLDIVQCLLDRGADANFHDEEHRTPLSLAAVEGHLEIVHVLVERNADVLTKDEDGSTPFHRVFIFAPRSHGDHRPQIVRFLLEHGTNPNARDNYRQTPLHVAASVYLDSSLLDIVQIFLAHGADVDAEDEEGRTPLQVALACGRVEMAQLLSGSCSK
jgi:ankyrin repeat protein